MNDRIVPVTEVSFEGYADRLIRNLGPVVGGAALTKALGYRSQAAFRQAAARNRLPVPTFEFEGRRGRFADTQDIAAWLWKQRISRERTQRALPNPEVTTEKPKRHHS